MPFSASTIACLLVEALARLEARADQLAVALEVELRRRRAGPRRAAWRRCAWSSAAWNGRGSIWNSGSPAFTSWPSSKATLTICAVDPALDGDRLVGLHRADAAHDDRHVLVLAVATVTGTGGAGRGRRPRLVAGHWSMSDIARDAPGRSPERPPRTSGQVAFLFILDKLPAAPSARHQFKRECAARLLRFFMRSVPPLEALRRCRTTHVSLTHISASCRWLWTSHFVRGQLLFKRRLLLYRCHQACNGH